MTFNRTTLILSLGALLGVAASVTACGSNCADTLTCEKPPEPGEGGGGEGGSGTGGSTTSAGGSPSVGGGTLAEEIHQGGTR